MELLPEVRRGWPGLSRAFEVVASPRVRNVATVGGVLADADYASDPPSMLVAAGALVELASVRGVRRVPVEEPTGDVEGESEVAEFQVFRPSSRSSFEVERVEGGFRVSGDAVERLIARHDLENEEALAHVEHRLRRMGVISALEKEGFEPGDDVEIAGILFELDPGAPA